MHSLPWISGLVLLLLQGSHSYILLTANLDDVHAIAKQIAVSPVAGQINRILRRASTIFNQQLRARDNEPIQDRPNRIERRNSDQGQHHNQHYRRSKAGELIDENKQKDHPITHVEGNSGEALPSEQQAKRLHDYEATSDHANKGNTTEFFNNEEKNSRKERRESLEDHSQSGKDVPSDNKHYNHGNTKERSQDTEHQESHKADEEESYMKRQNEETPRQEVDVRSHADEVVALGKNASYYLNSIKKIMENV